MKRRLVLKNKYTSAIKYTIPPAVTILFTLVILAIRGIYPFGSETIDYYDMSTQVSAFYYHVYDVLHGNKIYFFDWYSTLGSNMAITSGSSIFSIFNLYFLFVDRFHILESLSFFLALKMGLMSLSMYYCVHKAFDTDTYVEQLVSIGYGFCGFVLMNFSILSWLDYAILVPLILYFASRLIKSGKVLGFILTLALGLMANYYLAFMTLAYIFLEAGFYLLIYRPSQKSHNSHVLKLGLSVLAAFTLSAGALIPQLYMTMTSARAGNNVNGSALSFYTDILKQYNGGYASRWWVLLGLSFELAICLWGLINDFRVKNYKRLIFAASSMMIVSLPILFENVNIFWHFGSYVQYPLRFSFLIYLTYAFAACVYAKDLFTDNAPAEFAKCKKMIISFVTVPFLVYAGNRIHNAASYMPFSHILHITFVLIGSSFLIYLVFLLFKKGKYLRLSCCIWVSEMLIYGILTLGNQTYITGYNEEPEQERDSVRICRQLYSQLDLESSRIDRIKNPDESLNANYGFFLRQPALSNWTHLIPEQLQQSVQNLGYSTQFTRLLDAGGTVFTDALLHIRHVISVNEQDDALYTEINRTEVISKHVSGETATYYLYDTRYNLPFVLPVNGEKVHEVDNAIDIVSLHNALYEMICPDELQDDYDIAEYVAGNSSTSAPVDSPISINVKGKKALYFTGNCPDTEFRNLNLIVNDKPILIPDIGYPYNTRYSAHFNNNAVYLGTFDSEEVTVLIGAFDSTLEYTPCIFSVNLDMLSGLCDFYSSDDYECRCEAGTRSLLVDVTGDNSTSYMIPVAYNDGWKYYAGQTDNVKTALTSKKQAPANLLSCFMLLDANGGTVLNEDGTVTGNDVANAGAFANRFELSFTPPFLKEGLILSLLTVIILLLSLSPLKKYEALIDNQKINRITGAIYLAAWSAVLILIFIVPVFYGILCYLRII